MTQALTTAGDGMPASPGNPTRICRNRSWNVCRARNPGSAANGVLGFDRLRQTGRPPMRSLSSSMTWMMNEPGCVDSTYTVLIGTWPGLASTRQDFDVWLAAAATLCAEMMRPSDTKSGRAESAGADGVKRVAVICSLLPNVALATVGCDIVLPPHPSGVPPEIGRAS